MLKSTTFLLFLHLFGLLAFSQSGLTTITLTDKEVTASSYSNSEIIIGGQTDLHITALSNPLTNSVVNLNSEDSWVFFDNIRPDVVISSLLQYIKVNAQAAAQNTNARIAIYKQGTVVIPQPSTYQPLEVFTGKDYTGTNQKYSMFTFYSNLGALDNKIRSFKLKRGYMATFANNSDGTGYSRVFIADKEDLLISAMPDLLDQSISFIRVFNWEWVTKKGWCQTGSAGTPATNKVKATWLYSWSADQASTSTIEYVPIRQNGGWPGWDEIKGKQGVTHVLGFNEPDHTEQSNLTVSQALAQWPDMLKTGLRIGAPAVTNNSWLYQFMDSCDAHHYRVDFVPYHAYWGAKPPLNWYNDLKAIHDRTKRPIWITEWNNGANWTTETWPDASKALTTANAQKQLSDLINILEVMDTAHFIERYSIYNWVQDCRAIILADTLTPAGKYYAANNSMVAFNRINEVIPAWGGYGNPALSLTIGGTSTITLSSTDPNGEFNKGYRLEKKTDNGSYVKIQDTVGLKNVKYSEDINLSSFKRVRFRLRTILPGGLESLNTSEVGVDVTENADSIQFGNLALSNVGWNNVFFRKSYTRAVPAIIFGASTNNNAAVLMSNRVKQIDYNRFLFQLAPWAYQNVSALAAEEITPYLIVPAGKYNFGGLKAIANKDYANPGWTQITFSEPFDTIPVVFVTQLTSSATNATGVRVRNVTKTGFEARIQKESKVTTALYRETISYLAITPGNGVIAGKKVMVGKTTNAPIGTSTITTLQYGQTINNPVFIAQMQTCNDDTVTATLRCVSVFTTYARLLKQREKSLNITAAANEDAGWIIMDPESNMVGIKTIKGRELTISPNPVSDDLYFNIDFTGSTRVNIYNMYGTLMKSEFVSGNKMDVTNLPSGYYLLRTSNNFVAKFIKN